ncbi:DUF3791 domain-containing protein [Moraxella nasovis]|uniref:DUF3791 domain-containing protein n=1 Tax=Moraxella nasovis TaxID=2904121 RepID=UPI001F60456F|nr:DUF3791 domain-containing protein [Moraxella nasovis]UNU72561.1 DUF3791 domain-containing protein [Moraxella nasovis]
MSKEHAFFIYLLERYAEHKGKSTQTVLGEWERLHLTENIVQMYERYHSERLQNAFDDIDEMITSSR